MTPVFDESLCEFLLQHKFSIKNIEDILGTDTGIGPLIHYRYNTSAIYVPTLVDNFKQRFTGGCIFTLPSGRRDAKRYVIWSKLSSDEIRRIAKLSAFL